MTSSFAIKALETEKKALDKVYESLKGLGLKPDGILNALKESGEANELYHNGIYYGYPSCCSMAFSLGWNGVEKRKNFPFSTNINVGMVPCPSCLTALMLSPNTEQAQKDFIKKMDESRIAYWDKDFHDDYLEQYSDVKFMPSYQSDRAKLFFNELFSNTNDISQYFSFGGLYIPVKASERIAIHRDFFHGFEANDVVISLGYPDEEFVSSVTLKSINAVSNKGLISCMAIDGAKAQCSRLSPNDKTEYILSLLKKAGLKKDDVVVSSATSLSLQHPSVETMFISLMPRTQEAWDKLCATSSEFVDWVEDIPFPAEGRPYKVDWGDYVALDAILFETDEYKEVSIDILAEEKNGLLLLKESYAFTTDFTMSNFQLRHTPFQSIVEMIHSSSNMSDEEKRQITDYLVNRFLP